jgi:hypothetical protein
VTNAGPPPLLATALAGALVRRLDAVIPDPVRVFSTGDEITMWEAERDRPSDGLGPISQLGNAERLDDEWIHFICYHALDRVQDFVAEAIAEPWPARAHAFPRPWVRVTDQEIGLGYGEVLELPPIARSELA